MKKRFFLSLLMLLIFVVGLAACGNGGTKGTEGLKFLPLNDKECAVSAGDAKLMKEIVIPAKYNKYKVTAIYGGKSSDSGAGFSYCKNLTTKTFFVVLSKRKRLSERSPTIQMIDSPLHKSHVRSLSKRLNFLSEK